MQLKTTDSKFLTYGNSFPNTELLTQKIEKEFHIEKGQLPCIYLAQDDIFVRESIGIITITIGEGNNLHQMQTFILSKTIRIKKGTYFYFSTLTNSSNIHLYYDNETDLQEYGVVRETELHKEEGSFDITQLYFCSYSMKTAGYHFHSEKHSCWELTYVDEGKLNTNIDGVAYTLENNQYMFYVPNQRHDQDIPDDQNCSYLTIAFETDLKAYEYLQNTVFTCNEELMNIFYFFIHSDDHQRYINDYLKLKLKELMILTYHLEHDGLTREDSYYYNKLLNSIIDYINDHLDQDLTVDEICHIFGISRTMIQKIFKENLKMSPKNYIIMTKLSYSKIFLKQQKYMIDEVADMVGFATANYFSRMFKKQYGISPKKYMHLHQ